MGHAYNRINTQMSFTVLVTWPPLQTRTSSYTDHINFNFYFSLQQGAKLVD